MNYLSRIAGKKFEVTIDHSEKNLQIYLDGESLPVEFIRLNGTNAYIFIMENRSFEFEVGRNESCYVVYHGGRLYDCYVEDERLLGMVSSIRQEAAVPSHREIRSPMPGLIVLIEVQVGDIVKAGQGLVIIEAMKMENEIKAPADAIVTEIRVKPKEAVEMNQTLLILE